MCNLHWGSIIVMFTLLLSSIYSVYMYTCKPFYLHITCCGIISMCKTVIFMYHQLNHPFLYQRICVKLWSYIINFATHTSKCQPNCHFSTQTSSPPLVSGKCIDYISYCGGPRNNRNVYFKASTICYGFKDTLICRSLNV